MSDNGGGYAIRGFNYQWAVLALIAIRNLKKDDLKMIVESKDDIEVLLSGSHTFIQVKSAKLSFSKITSNSEEDKTDSVLIKLISKGSNGERYKIVSPNNFASKDRKKLKLCSTGVVFSDYYCLSEEAVVELLEMLNIEEDQEGDFRRKLSGMCFHFTEFSPNMEAAIRSLLGFMTENNIQVDDSRGVNALAQFILYAQIIAEKDGSQNKELQLNYVRQIFKTTETHQRETNILGRLSFSILDEDRIKIEKAKIPLMYQTEKNKFLQNLQSYPIEGKTEARIISEWREIVAELSNLSEPAISAILIEILAKRIEEEI